MDDNCTKTQKNNNTQQAPLQHTMQRKTNHIMTSPPPHHTNAAMVPCSSNSGVKYPLLSPDTKTYKQCNTSTHKGPWGPVARCTRLPNEANAPACNAAWRLMALLRTSSVRMDTASTTAAAVSGSTVSSASVVGVGRGGAGSKGLVGMTVGSRGGVTTAGMGAGGCT